MNAAVYMNFTIAIKQKCEFFSLLMNLASVYQSLNYAQ